MRLHEDYAAPADLFREALVTGLSGMPGAVCHAGAFEMLSIRAERERRAPALTPAAPRGGIAARIRRIGKAIFHGADERDGGPDTRRVPV